MNGIFILRTMGPWLIIQRGNFNLSFIGGVPRVQSCSWRLGSHVFCRRSRINASFSWMMNRHTLKLVKYWHLLPLPRTFGIWCCGWTASIPLSLCRNCDIRQTPSAIWGGSSIFSLFWEFWDRVFQHKMLCENAVDQPSAWMLLCCGMQDAQGSWNASETTSADESLLQVSWGQISHVHFTADEAFVWKGILKCFP